MLNSALNLVRIMEYSVKIIKSKDRLNNLTTFPVPSSIVDFSDENYFSSEKLKNLNTDDALSKAFKCHSEGNTDEAYIYYKYCIEKGLTDPRIFINFGIILKNDGRLKEAEIITRKAIKLKPDSADAYCNLGNILYDLKNLEKAKESILEAIKLRPKFSEAYFNFANILKDQGKLDEAENVIREAIQIKPSLAMAHCCLSGILQELGNLKDAEIAIRKAIEINPNYSIALANLGSILLDLGQLKEAEYTLLKSIEKDINLAKSYFMLSTLNTMPNGLNWQEYLFSKGILKNRNNADLIDIYFARSNILHKQNQYEESSKYLQLANNLKLKIFPSNKKKLLLQSQSIYDHYQKEYLENDDSFMENIFIVGMPRSGSTLVESIISMNPNVFALGESNIFEESLEEYERLKRENYQSNLSKIYCSIIRKYTSQSKISTNKCLYNYLYIGKIASAINNAKIVHCFRNPLDNILSIYRANFAKGNEYSTSLIDCAEVYLNQDEIMRRYKLNYGLNIYNLNYDLLVMNPNYEIRALIAWLEWSWDDAYLCPHFNQRTISTASTVQVRSPINNKSVGGWKNYKKLLQPAIDIIMKSNHYRGLVI